MSKSRTHIFEIHLLRAIACLLVVLVHVSATVYDEQGNIWNDLTFFMNQFGRFGTPMFALISAFLLIYQIRKRGFDLKRFLSTRFTKIGLPFLFWSIFYWVLMYIWRGENPFASGMKAFTGNLVFGNAAYHLYFMSIVFQFYVLFLLLRFIRSKTSWTILLGVAFAINLYFVNYFSAEQLNGTMKLIVSQRAFLPNWIFYFIFGGFLAYFWEPFLGFAKKYKAPLSVVALIIALGAVWEYKEVGWVSSNRATNMINIPLLTLFVMGIASTVSKMKWINAFFTEIGTLSMAIYLVHPFVLYSYQVFAPEVVWTTSFLPVLYALVLITSILLVKAIQFIPGNQYVLTVPKVKLPSQGNSTTQKYYEVQSNKRKQAASH
jgi:probable poly-beta-1,6-N-acetyl-D-glucosamine export protein